ncbi:uncharacterized protein LOC130891443 [Diorhabda carinulata]|uniref:uncharacterized protein LOC130891443 n=1 Tax=Diorhabda carinulata TaxID=1163345 RepID=UPI0025A04FE4|nr:uncharacterized protein LOC130891443 [Diorhabda carinulata]
MEQPLLKKKSRRIRCTEELNKLLENSLDSSSSKSESGKNKVTKKKKLLYSAEINLNIDPVKENCSPNVEQKQSTKKSKKTLRNFIEHKIESGDTRVCSMKNETSAEEDHRDSEFEFKIKKKRKKHKKQTKSSSDVISENETTIEINKKSVLKKEKKSLNSVTSYSKSINLDDNATRQSRNSISKDPKSFKDQSTESSESTSRGMRCKRKTKNSVLKDHENLNNHTSESLSPKPVSSESDDVFEQNIESHETMNSFPNEICKDNQKNSNTEMLVSELQENNISEFFSENESLYKMNTNEKGSVRFTTQPTMRRSKSLNESFNKSSKKSISFMTPGRNNYIQTGSPMTNQIKQSKSLNTTKKSSVSFASVDSTQSKSFGKKNSKIFPKSPHVSRLTRNNSVSFNEIEFLQDEGPPEMLQKYSNLRKPTTNYIEMSGKKSVSFFTPANDNKKKPKTSFKKSPYICRSTIDLSSSDKSLNETFQLTSPTIELETLKNKSVVLSPTASTLSEGSNIIFSSKKSILNLVTPSPQTGSSSYILSTCDVSDKTKGSSEVSKSDAETNVTRRKHWNRSLGVSIMDSDGMLHNISSPWRNEDFNKVQNTHEQHNYTTDSFISPIEKIDSTSKGYISSKTVSPIKIQQNVEHSLNTVKSETVISEHLNTTFSPLEKDKSLKKLGQSKPSKQENKVLVKRTKLPNFALIHQRAYDKLENVREMSQRKAARAQQLLSGKKPGPDLNMKIPTSNLKIKSPNSKLKSPKSRKLLRYTPKKSHPLENLPEPCTSSIVVVKTSTKITPSKSNPKKIVKPVIKKTAKSNIPKIIDKKPLSKLGFKIETTGKDNKVIRQDQLKAAANKTKPSRNSLEARRTVIQNVRTNRRFDLLMKMRKKD